MAAQHQAIRRPQPQHRLTWLRRKMGPVTDDHSTAAASQAGAAAAAVRGASSISGAASAAGEPTRSPATASQAPVRHARMYRNATRTRQACYKQQAQRQKESQLQMRESSTAASAGTQAKRRPSQLSHAQPHAPHMPAGGQQRRCWPGSSSTATNTKPARHCSNKTAGPPTMVLFITCGASCDTARRPSAVHRRCRQQRWPGSQQRRKKPAPQQHAQASTHESNTRLPRAVTYNDMCKASQLQPAESCLGDRRDAHSCTGGC